MATKIKMSNQVIFKITPGGAMVYDKSQIFKNSFWDGDVWPVERPLNRSFWRVGN